MKAVIKSQQVFEDASGAPTLIVVESLVYAFDYLGEIRCNLVTRRNMRRGFQRKAQRIAEAEYARILSELPADFFTRNAEMYA